MNVKNDFIRGLIEANLPQLAAAVGAYYTFNDLPYAGLLAFEQVKHSVILRSVIGVGFEMLGNL